MLRREFWQGVFGLIGFGSISFGSTGKNSIIERSYKLSGNLEVDKFIKELKRKDYCICDALMSLDKYQGYSKHIQPAIDSLCEALDGVKSNES